MKIIIQNKELVCDICGSNDWVSGRVFVDTAEEITLTSKTLNCYTCAECEHVVFFAKEN